MGRIKFKIRVSRKYEGECMNIVKKIVKHTLLVSKHKWLVFRLSVKAGIPFRGLIHDLSKFSSTEFFESIKYSISIIQIYGTRRAKVDLPS